MNCDVASIQCSTRHISIYCRNVDMECIGLPWLTLFAQGLYRYLELNDLPIINNPFTGEPGLIAFYHQKIEGDGFQVQFS